MILSGASRNALPVVINTGTERHGFHSLFRGTSPRDMPLSPEETVFLEALLEQLHRSLASQQRVDILINLGIVDKLTGRPLPPRWRVIEFRGG